MKFNTIQVEISATLLLGIAFRAIVSLHPYSGAAKPPIYGDYEAQRHWQEITVNLEPIEWYKNSSKNDLLYWGLDYPPLTAYHSYLMGITGKSINESFLQLTESRGLETSEHKSFMRLTVLLADICLFVPGALVVGISLGRTFKKTIVLPFLILIMLYPGQILIDNGHFQYNNISLGLAAFAIASILSNHYHSSAFFFTLAINYKQMELYHALPFFVFLLRTCLAQKSFIAGIRKLILIGSTVLFTGVVLWFPWIRSFDSITTVITRLFPINRGVFEDKVANFWCALNIVYKLKEKYSNHQMAFLCLGATIIAAVPLNISLFIVNKKEKFLYCLFNTAMAFFLFSFQVHEKSILLVVLPVICLFGFQPFEVFWFLEVTVISLFPLLIKDGLIIPFFSMVFVHHIFIKVIYMDTLTLPHKSNVHKLSKFYTISTFLAIFLALMAILAPVPLKYPYIWSILISLFSCSHFILFFCFGIRCQFSAHNF